MRSKLLSALSGVFLSARLTSPACADLFTFSPSAAAPSLEGTTFSADAIY